MGNNNCSVRRLSAYGKEVQRKYDRHEIGWAYYIKLMRKPKCREWGIGYGY